MIPAAAVEAAARNLYVSEHGPWDGVSGITSAHLTRARAALEAAAPHMLAAAFDEAASAWAEASSWSDGNPSPEQVQRWLRSRANTYRTPNAS